MGLLLVVFCCSFSAVFAQCNTVERVSFLQCFPVSNAASQCDLRINSLRLPLSGCQGGLNLEHSLILFDNSTATTTPNFATFNAYVFGSAQKNEVSDFFNCSTPQPSNAVKLFALRSCIDETISFGTEKNSSVSNGPILIVQCLRTDQPCQICVSSRASCTLKNTGALSIGIVGIVLSTIALISCVVLGLVLLRRSASKTSASFISWEVWLQIACIFVALSLLVAFWSSFVVTSVFEFPLEYQYGMPSVRPSFYALMTDLVFWLDKLILVVAVLIHLGLLYLFATAAHPNRIVPIRVIFAIVSFLIVGSLAFAVASYLQYLAVLPMGTFYFLLPFYGINFGLVIAVAVALLVYGIFLLCGHGFIDKNAGKTIVLLVIIFLSSAVRLTVNIISWSEALSFTADSRVYYAGFHYYQINFPSHQYAQLFYIFGFLLPDLVPIVTIMWLLLASMIPQKEERKRSESEVPLLEENATPYVYRE